MTQSTLLSNRTINCWIMLFLPQKSNNSASTFMSPFTSTTNRYYIVVRIQWAKEHAECWRFLGFLWSLQSRNTIVLRTFRHRYFVIDNNCGQGCNVCVECIKMLLLLCECGNNCTSDSLWDFEVSNQFFKPHWHRNQTLCALTLVIVCNTNVCV